MAALVKGIVNNSYSSNDSLRQARFAYETKGDNIMGNINPQKEALRIIGKIHKNVQKKSWPCMCTGCDKPAINSHLLMRNGILNYVVEDGHLYELRSDSPEAFRKEKLPISFKKVGINQSISFPLFCNEHDTSLFKEIEDGGVDYTSYRHMALYSYRALSAEIRKKEITTERERRITESSTIKGLLGTSVTENFSRSYKQGLRGIRDLEYYKEQILSDLNTGTKSFIFLSREIPLKGIYASTISSIFASTEETMFAPILNTFFFHLIPLENASWLVIGYHQEHTNDKIIEYANRWMEAPIEIIGKMLTALFCQIETWGMSPSVYAKLNPDNLRAYYAKLETSLNTVNQTPLEDINLFEGII